MRGGGGVEEDILQSRGIMFPTVEFRREDGIRCVPIKRSQVERCGSCGAGLGGLDEAWFQGPAFQCRFVVLGSDYGHIECVGGCRGCSCGAGEDGCEAFEQNHDAARTEEVVLTGWCNWILCVGEFSDRVQNLLSRPSFVLIDRKSRAERSTFISANCSLLVSLLAICESYYAEKNHIVKNGVS